MTGQSDTPGQRALLPKPVNKCILNLILQGTRIGKPSSIDIYRIRNNLKVVAFTLLYFQGKEKFQHNSVLKI